MTIQFLHRMHNPATYPLQAPALAPEILETWLHYAPDAQPDERDWEDWAENAIMLHEAHHASQANVRILPQADNIRINGDKMTYVPSNPGAPLGFMYGMWMPSDTISFPNDVDMIGNNADVVKAVTAYAKSDIFLKAANRAFHVVDADFDQIETALLALHRAGHRKVFIKTRFKEAAELLVMPENPKNIWAAITFGTPFEWFLIQYEGMKDALYIQEAFAPTKEYRTFIVGDCAVTGAGCIEAFTPLHNDGAAFDPRIELVRNRSVSVQDLEATERYRSFAIAYAKDWAAENGNHMIYSLDLAINEDTDEVWAIEMNPMTNLGLYACNPQRLIKAVQARFG